MIHTGQTAQLMGVRLYSRSACLLRIFEMPSSNGDLLLRGWAAVYLLFATRLHCYYSQTHPISG